MDHSGERSPLLSEEAGTRQRQRLEADGDAGSMLNLYLSKSEQRLGETYVGERLPYSDYSSIDFLHDLVRA